MVNSTHFTALVGDGKCSILWSRVLKDALCGGEVADTSVM